MKKTILTILAFAVILAALFGLSELKKALQPASDAKKTGTVEVKSNSWDTELNIDGATRLELKDTAIAMHGEGVSVSGSSASIVYPGSYRISGSLTDGQIIVDSSNDGAVYLILDGADIACSDGPAIFIKNAGSVELYLMPETSNSLRDGANYATVLLEDGSVDPDQPDAALFSRDDLTIEGEGILNVVGSNANGIRSKDLLTVKGGNVTVSAAADGIKATDGVTVESGRVDLRCADDGLCSNKGFVTVNGGELNVACYGDAVSAFSNIDIQNGLLTVSYSTEAMEAPVIRIADGWIDLKAVDKAFSAAVADLESGLVSSDCSLWIGGGTVFAEAPVAIKSEGGFAMDGGSVFLVSTDAQEDVLKAVKIAVKGGLLFMSGYMPENPLPDTIGVKSVFFKMTAAAEAGTEVSLKCSEEDSEAFLTYAPNAAYDAVCIAYAGLSARESYILSCGETVTSAFTPEQTLTVASVPAAVRSSGRGSGGFRPF